MSLELITQHDIYEHGTSGIAQQVYDAVADLDDSSAESAFRLVLGSVCDVTHEYLTDEIKLECLRREVSRLEIRITRDTQPDKL